MKICHMTDAHDPEDVRIFHKECVSLAKAGYEVWLVERGESYDKNGVHIVGVGDIPDGRLERMTKGAKAVYEAAKALDCDLYHFHDPELMPYALKLRRQGKKVVFDSHEDYPAQIREKTYLGPFAKLVAWGFERYERHVLKKLDAAVFPCPVGGKNLFDGLCRRAETISNAAILSEFYDRYDPAAPKTENSVCYVGSLTADRGILQDVLAAHRAGATLLLAGGYDSESYENTVRTAPEYACVDYRGLLDRAGVAALLQESRVGLCTLLDKGQYYEVEGFGLKECEYMSMGLPLILSDSPFYKRMVAEYGIGLCVDPEDTEQFADAIRYLLENPGEVKRMGENGRRAVKEEFNWGVEEKKLLALYRSVLEDN